MNFTVNEIAEITKTNKETVLRWIKAGKLKATLKSNKEGYSISADDLKAFLESNQKYMAVASKNLTAISSGVAGSVITGAFATTALASLGMAGVAAVPVVGVPLAAVIGVASGIGMRLYKKKKNVTKSNFEEEIKTEIAENEKKIIDLEAEISTLKTRNENLKQALELDLDNVVDSLNSNL